MSSQAAEARASAIDKSAWPDGPWKTEPDRVEWQHAGYACLLVRHDFLGHWCGYVGVEREHPLYGKPYSDEEAADLCVHGGLTYAHKCQGDICHVPEPGMPDDVWWLGFDAAHSYDLSPGLVVGEIAKNRLLPAELAQKLREINDRHLVEDTYRDMAYMRAQTEALAEQLRMLVP